MLALIRLVYRLGKGIGMTLRSLVDTKMIEASVAHDSTAYLTVEEKVDSSFAATPAGATGCGRDRATLARVNANGRHVRRSLTRESQ